MLLMQTDWQSVAGDEALKQDSDTICWKQKNPSLYFPAGSLGTISVESRV